MRLYWPECRARICARNEKCRGWPRGINKKNITRVSLSVFSLKVLSHHRSSDGCRCSAATMLSHVLCRALLAVSKRRERERKTCVCVCSKNTLHSLSLTAVACVRARPRMSCVSPRIFGLSISRNCQPFIFPFLAVASDRRFSNSRPTCLRRGRQSFEVAFVRRTLTLSFCRSLSLAPFNKPM